MMIKLGTAYPHHPIYEDISGFARAVYQQRLAASIEGRPDFFIYATSNEKIVGCAGMTRASDTKQLMLESQVPHAFERITNKKATPRTLFAEAGTRAVQLPIEEKIRTDSLSIGLLAASIIEANMHGIQYVCFTANRGVFPCLRTLNIRAHDLGPPDNSDKDVSFQDNWKRFSKTKQHCYGAEIVNCVPVCHLTMESLRQHGIHY